MDLDTGGWTTYGASQEDEVDMEQESRYGESLECAVDWI